MGSSVGGALVVTMFVTVSRNDCALCASPSLTRSVTVAGLSACLMKPLSMGELRRHLHESVGLDS